MGTPDTHRAICVVTPREKGTRQVPEPTTVEPVAPKRLHKATYATDKRNPGGYLIRIEGPTAGKFNPGREVPVVRKDNSETLEKLGRCVWAGIDEETGTPVALYHFESKPRDEAKPEDLPF